MVRLIAQGAVYGDEAGTTSLNTFFFSVVLGKESRTLKILSKGTASDLCPQPDTLRGKELSRPSKCSSKLRWPQTPGMAGQTSRVQE